MPLRPYQDAAVAEATAFLAAAGPGKNLMLGLPTGSGKSFVINEVRRVAPGGLLCVPSHEIAVGIASKADPAAKWTRAALERAGVYTVKRLYNLLLDAAIPLPRYVIFDEAHHTTDDTHRTVHAVTGLVPAVGLTATMYRGTPAETAKLHELWPVRKTMLSITDAIDQGVIARPSFETWPLLDDELIDVQNGEFKTTAVESVFRDKLSDVADRIRTFYDPAAARWDRPTMVALTGVPQVALLSAALEEAGCPTATVTADTPDGDRSAAFASCLSRERILIQVNVVSEGVDLAVRRLVDLAPTMSPVRWVQRLGRITRPTAPGEAPPEYIAGCHNITRHAYLWAGAIPAAAVVQAQAVWGKDRKPTRKSMARAIGLTGFGRFEVTPVPLAGGLTVSLYALQTKNGLDQYAVVLHPLVERPYFFHKQNALTGETGTFRKPDGTVIQYKTKTYGPWTRVNGLPELTGCVSIPADRITDNMTAKWADLAGRYGLDPTHAPDGRSFQILPICWNTKTRFPQE